MVSKYRLCRIGASIGASVGLIVLIWLLFAQAGKIFGGIGFGFGLLINLLKTTPVAVGVFAAGLITCAIVCGYISLKITSDNDMVSFWLFFSSVCLGIIWMTFCAAVVFAVFSVPRVFPPNSSIALLPSLTILLSVIFYNTDMFKFCDRFKK